MRDGVAWVTLARPRTRNRLDAELSSALVEACEQVGDDPTVRVVVVAAAGAHFSHGLPDEHAWLPASWPDAVAAVAAVEKPIVAGLAGEARGWGASLALACDLRVAATDARLDFPEVARGRLPGGGATQRLTRIVGPARALELLLLGETADARRLVEWGVVSRLVPRRRLHPTLDAVARELAGRGPLALALAKEAVMRALDLPLADGLRLEHDLYVLLQTTADRAEGVRAFLGRRRPRFRGR